MAQVLLVCDDAFLDIQKNSQARCLDGKEIAWEYISLEDLTSEISDPSDPNGSTASLTQEEIQEISVSVLLVFASVFLIRQVANLINPRIYS